MENLMSSGSLKFGVFNIFRYKLLSLKKKLQNSSLILKNIKNLRNIYKIDLNVNDMF